MRTLIAIVTSSAVAGFLWVCASEWRREQRERRALIELQRQMGGTS